MPRLRSTLASQRPTAEPSLIHRIPAWATDRSVRPEVRAARLAARQGSLVTREQLAAIGVGPGAIDRALLLGRMHRVHRGVFLLGPPHLTALGRLVAALLAAGPDAVLQGPTALGHFELAAPPFGPVHVLRPGRDRARMPGIVVHTTGTLDPRDLRHHRGLPVTAPARTILDVASGLDERGLRRLVDEAIARRLVRASDLADVVARHPGRRGTGRLRALLDDEHGPPTLTRSEAERRLLRLVRDAGFPRPETNVRIFGTEVDVLWRSQRVIAEVDGFAFHGSRTAFERDRSRDAELQSRGWQVLRFTWRRICDEPEVVIATLRRTFNRHSSTPAMDR